MMKFQLFNPISFLLFIASTSTLVSQEPPRRGIGNPSEPWAFRTVLDTRPRVLVAAFDDSLWAAWDTQRCRLFQIWKPGEQGVRLQGIVFDGAHGPQPIVDGSRLHEEPAESAWFLPGEREPVAAAVRYRGHRTGVPGQITLTYQVMLPDGESMISIEETPSFKADTSPSMARRFSIKGLPQGLQVALQLGGDTSTWRVEGRAGKLHDRGDRRHLVIKENGEVTLVGTWKSL
ncbi:MAG: hypothetical protein EAZ65_01760 [Verrucomicrobia bacterium]|nr:MAG: hypothetical protein EAZ84_10985 [Verrucomicrobiota bacterium]TAE89077.1 MAG: hypothetical protein EAZ82_00140 [Verrucomicrobiota bacterium]TAF42898.1 MAG: hypothetical protein EAZ65_01760 [Verrucomicrobiota bacterium]